MGLGAVAPPERSTWGLLLWGLRPGQRRAPRRQLGPLRGAARRDARPSTEARRGSAAPYSRWLHGSRFCAAQTRARDAGLVEEGWRGRRVAERSSGNRHTEGRRSNTAVRRQDQVRSRPAHFKQANQRTPGEGAGPPKK